VGPAALVVAAPEHLGRFRLERLLHHQPPRLAHPATALDRNPFPASLPFNSLRAFSDPTSLAIGMPLLSDCRSKRLKTFKPKDASRFTFPASLGLHPREVSRSRNSAGSHVNLHLSFNKLHCIKLVVQDGEPNSAVRQPKALRK
jgi:hypothetical protein